MSSAYIDVLFFLNFMMDAMVLLAVSRMQRSFLDFCWKRIAAGALAGAFGGTIMTVLTVGGQHFLGRGMWAVAAGICLCVLMVGVSFRPVAARGWIRGVISVYAVSFLLGGIMKWLQESLGSVQYFTTVTVSFLLLIAGQIVFAKVKVRQQRLCTVRVVLPACSKETHGRVIQLKGLVDTGNLLKMPETGKPVSVVWADAIYEGLTKEQKQQYKRLCCKRTNNATENSDTDDDWECTIEKETVGKAERMSGWSVLPYHSVGCAHGIMPVLAVPYLCIRTKEQEHIVHGSYLAMSPRPVSSTDGYQILLNPELLH